MAGLMSDLRETRGAVLSGEEVLDRVARFKRDHPDVVEDAQRFSDYVKAHGHEPPGVYFECLPEWLEAVREAGRTGAPIPPRQQREVTVVCDCTDPEVGDVAGRTGPADRSADGAST